MQLKLRSLLALAVAIPLFLIGPTNAFSLSNRTKVHVASHQLIGSSIRIGAPPSALLLVGSDLWVASCEGDSVTEIDTTSREIVQTLSAPSYVFLCPDALAFDGTNLWVADKSGNSLTEFDPSNTNPTPTVITSPDILGPLSLVVIPGEEMWVGNSPASGHTQPRFIMALVNTNTGAVLQTARPVSDREFACQQANFLAYGGADVWVSSFYGTPSVCEYNSTTGKFLGVLPTVQDYSPYAIFWERGVLLVTDGSGEPFDEYNAATRSLVRKVNVPNGGIIVSNGTDIFTTGVPDATSLSEIPPLWLREYSITGRFVRTIATFSSKNNFIDCLALAGSRIWVANSDTDSVSEYGV